MSTHAVSPVERNITIVAVILGLITLPLILSKCYLDKGVSSAELSTVDSLNYTEGLDGSGESDYLTEVDSLTTQLESAYGREEVLQLELTEARNKAYALEQQLKEQSTTSLNSSTGAAVVTSAALASKSSKDEEEAKIAAQKQYDAELERDSAKANATELKTEVASLTGKLATANTSNTELTDKLALLKKEQAEKDAAATTTRDGKINSVIDQLREENTLLRVKQKEALAANEAATKKFNNKQKQLLSTAQAEKAALLKQIKELRTKAAFASSAADLDKKSVALYNKLQALEGQSPEELNASYDSINKDLKATSMTRVKFNTGSTSLNDESTKMIETLLAGDNAGYNFLIVGYASKQGSKDVNETISSTRAKSVSSKVINSLKTNNSVQAVYLGETSRFGPLAENQCVEIWKLEP